MDLAQLHLHWRVSRHKEKEYRSYSLAHAYRKDGKNRKEIVVKLGKLSEKDAERWRNFLKTIKNPGAFFTTHDNIVVTDWIKSFLKTGNEKSISQALRAYCLLIVVSILFANLKRLNGLPKRLCPGYTVSILI